jgi:hypothetical protein
MDFRPPTLDYQLKRIEGCYEEVDDILRNENTTPEMAIRAFQLEQRLDRLVEILENYLKAKDN